MSTAGGEPELSRALAIAARVLRLEAESVLALCDRLGDTFLAAVRALHACRGRVVVTGIGKSSHVGRKLAATLASTGTPAYFLHPAEGVHGDIGMLAAGDVVVALSNSGETEEMLRLLPVIKRLELPLVLLTGDPGSALARQSDIVLDVGVREEACPMNLAPTSSTTAALAMGDALAMVLASVPTTTRPCIPAEASAGRRSSAWPISCTRGTRCRWCRPARP
jgi:arabinose-5-phosphate isomerase